MPSMPRPRFVRPAPHGRRYAQRRVAANEIVAGVAGRRGRRVVFRAWLRLWEGCGKIVVSRLARQPLSRGSPGRSDPPKAPLAQLDRASGYEPGGRRFESCRARQLATVYSERIGNTLFRADR